jgi:hypothetical protein
VPTTLSGLLLFVALLTPGFCYLVRRERLAAGRRLSPFRETIAIVFTSVVALSIALGLFALVHLLLPTHTPDIGRLVRASGDYAKQEYAYLSLWAVGVLLTACLIAVIAAKPPVWVSSLLTDPQAIEHVSAWWRLFQALPKHKKRVICRLDDGTFVEGWLWLYNAETDETGDRELVLGGDLTIRQPDGQMQRTKYGGISISARRIVYLYVDYEYEMPPTGMP